MITGRLPLYNDIVWAKWGAYRWWPALVLHPSFVPDNIEKVSNRCICNECYLSVFPIFFTEIHLCTEIGSYKLLLIIAR